MTAAKRYVQEASRLAPKGADGTYRLRLIDEGTGSTGVYSGELLENSIEVFENAGSFINHPIDPERPDLRDLNSIAGRISNVGVFEDANGKYLEGDYKARAEYIPLIEEFGDIIGASIFCGAYGQEDETGRIVVESFDGDDPYRSVDLVVAAGRGGRFKRANESLRAIETSLGSPKGSKPAAASAQESIKTQEEHMDEAKVKEIVVAAVAEALAPINTFLAEEGVRRQAEADAAAGNDNVTEAVEAAVAAVEAVKAAKVLPSFEKKLIESATKGADVTEELAFAVTVTAEASASNKNESSESFYIHESAKGAPADDFSLSNMGGQL